MFTKKTTWFSLIVLLVLSLMLAACGGGGDTEEPAEDNSGAENDTTTEEETKDEEAGLELGQTDLTIPYVAWAREIVSTHILAALLEEVGYNVEVRQVEAGPMWASVADGSADLHTSAWLPATHAEYWEQYEGDIVKVKQVIDEAPLALAVPGYVEDVNTMEDLKTNTEFGESVDWTIVGIDAGAGIMANTEKAIEEYGLDNWELTSSSETAMITELKAAYENEEPIIVPMWKPHWAFGVWDLKMLEDPLEIYGGAGDQIYTVARAGLEEDAPAAYRVLEQYDESYEMLDELMPKVWQDDEDPADVAQQFLADNPDLVEEWTAGVN